MKRWIPKEDILEEEKAPAWKRAKVAQNPAPTQGGNTPSEKQEPRT
jgi:hypothetical protein